MDDKKKSGPLADRGVREALCFLALSLALILYSLAGQYSGIRYAWKMSPYLFPLLVALLLLGLGAALLISALRARRAPGEGEKRSERGIARPLAACGLAAAYTLALKLVPFAPATAVLLALLLLLFGEKRIPALLLIPLLTTALIWLLLGAALHVALP